MNYDMTYEQALAEARERSAAEREISNDTARVLLAAWISPRFPAITAVATGAWSPESLTIRDEDDTVITRGDEFRDELYDTFHNYQAYSEEALIWGMLGTWSMNGGDNETEDDKWNRDEWLQQAIDSDAIIIYGGDNDET